MIHPCYVQSRNFVQDNSWVCTWLACAIGSIFAHQSITASVSELHHPFDVIHVDHAKAIVKDLVALKASLVSKYLEGKNLNEAHLDRNFPPIYTLLINANLDEEEITRDAK